MWANHSNKLNKLIQCEDTRVPSQILTFNTKTSKCQQQKKPSYQKPCNSPMIKCPSWLPGVETSKHPPEKQNTADRHCEQTVSRHPETSRRSDSRPAAVATHHTCPFRRRGRPATKAPFRICLFKPTSPPQTADVDVSHMLKPTHGITALPSSIRRPSGARTNILLH